MQELTRSSIVISLPDLERILRKQSVQAPERDAEFLGAGIQVAIGAGEVVAGIALGLDRRPPGPIWA